MASSVKPQTYNSCITSISHSFALQLSLTDEEKKVLTQMDRNASILRNDLYQTKTIAGLYFHVEVGKTICPMETCVKHGNYLNISIKDTDTWSFKLVYAFLVTKDRVFSLKNCTRLHFLSSFESERVLPEDNMTIYFLVKASQVRPAPHVKNDNKLRPKDQNGIELEELPTFPFPSDYNNEIVICFLLGGEIPHWTVDMAIKIMSETKDHKCEMLKMICEDFLASKIDKQNVNKMRETAVEYCLSRLATACRVKFPSNSAM